MMPATGEDSTRRPVVAHLHNVFFEKSETFIHRTVTSLRHYHPILLAWEYRNLELFPFPARDRYALSSSRYSPSWWVEAITRRLGKREIRGEKILCRRQAQLIHAHFGPSGVLAIRLARTASLPLVTTFYGNDMSQLSRNPFWQKCYQELFTKGDLFLVEGPNMRDHLVELGCSTGKIEIQRIAIPVADLPFRPRPAKMPGQKAIIVFAGRFVEKKGLLIALQALSEVYATHPEFEFRIIGDGPLQAEIGRFIQNHKMNAYVRLLGFLHYNDYLEEMKKADLFLHPSITAADGDSEGGAPTTILEAQALGMPVISTRHADIPNIVEPGRSALLSSEGNIEELVTNITRLLEDRECWSSMGAAGRYWVESFHDTCREIPRLEARYAELIQAYES